MIESTLEFAAFVAEYPKCRRNIKKRDALKAWNQAMNRQVRPETIMETLRTRICDDWQPCGPEGCFHPYMATFLRGETFEGDDRPPLFKSVADPMAELWARAEVLHDRWTEELGQWELATALHRHDWRCHHGEVCVYVTEKRPDVPSVEEIVQRLKV